MDDMPRITDILRELKSVRMRALTRAYDVSLCLVSSAASGTSRCAPRSNSSAPSQEASSLLVSEQAVQLQVQQPANPQLLIEPSPPDLSRPQPSPEPSAHALSSPEEDQQPNHLAHGSPEPPLQQPSATVLSGPGQALLPGPPALSKHEARKARRVFPSLIPPPALPAAQDQLAAVFSNGAVLIDKPLGWTSFDVVAKLRSALRSLGVGHSGTLDPMATGLLILGTGAGTRFCDEFTAMRKSYS
ncbi:TruB_N domain-containing protein, partial [Haematococcus lacustris]